MRRSDLAIAIALTLVVHSLLFAVAGAFTNAQVVYKRGDSSMDLVLLPSIASQPTGVRKEPEPERPKEPPKPVERTETKPKAPAKPAEKVVKPQERKTASLPLPEYPPLDDLLPWLEAESSPPLPEKQKPEPPTPSPPPKENSAALQPDRPPQPEKVEKPTPEATKAPKREETPQDALPAEKPAPPSKEVEADLRTKGVTTKAQAASLERPVYPRSCRRLGHEGDAVYEFTINPDGTCANITLIKSAGCPDLDEAARESLLRATFVPAKRFGIAVSSRKRLVFRFRLADADE